MVRIALSVAFLCVSAMITVPVFAIPFTLQSFAVFSVLGLLGWKAGGASILVYLMLGALGLPVFSGFSGGIGVLFGQTGGFLFGFLLAVPVFAIFETLSHGRRFFLACGTAAGLLVSYLAGALWYYFLFARDTSFVACLAVTVLPFLLPDAVKMSLALLVSKRMKREIL